LIPQRISPDYLLVAYVLNDDVGAKLEGLGFALPIAIDADLFFH
jgi:hypothetical protein